MDKSVIFVRFLLIWLLSSGQTTLSKSLDIVIPSTTTLYLEVILNGKPTKKILPINYYHGHYYMMPEQLKSLGILIPISEKIKNPVAIDIFKNVFTYYDSAMQRFLINIPPNWLPRQNIIMSKFHQAIPAQSSLGLLFNYDFYCIIQNNLSNHNSQCSNWSELRVFNQFGVFSNTGTWNHGIEVNDTYHYIRYDTQLHFSDQRHMLLYILGDFDSEKLSWSNTMRLGGIKISRNFSIRPDLITYPLPYFSGHARLPSTLDLYINNNQIHSIQINPGPFTIDSLPYLHGAGKATLVLKDILGNKQSKMMSYYVANEQLKKGLTDFSISLGLIRKNYGINSTDYGDLATSNFLRYGLNSWLTLEGKLEGTHHMLNSGLGAGIKMFTLGLINISWSGSIRKNHSEYDNLIIGNQISSRNLNSPQGQQILIDYTYNNMSLNISAQNILRSAGYSDLSNYQTNTRLGCRNSQIIGSLALGKYGTLSLGWFNYRDNWINNPQLINLSYSTTLWQTVSLWTSIEKNLGNQGGYYNAQLILTIPLKAWGNASYSYMRDINNSRIRTSMSRTVPASGGIGWNFALDQNYHQADVFLKNPYFEMGAGMNGNHYNENYWSEINGSLVAMAGHIYTTNSIPDAFVLVSSNGYPKIPVRYENQLMGITNKYGYLLVPSVTSWYQSQIEIDPINLPMDVKIPQIIHKFSIRELSGDLINFDIHKFNATSFRVIDKHGKSLPIGSTVKLEGSSKLTWLGWDGELWLEDLKSHNILNITRADTGTTCKLLLTITKDHHGISTLGPQICQ
ncbi:MAG: fimbria/pilus outer membrane usher protein [Candidatus Dasytiphilus stammeri]